MRLALTPVLLLVGCAAATTPPAPAAQGAPSPGQLAGPAQVWRGALRCGPVQGFGSLPLNQPIEVTVSGNTARYDRAVRRTDTTAETDIHEHGGGTVAADGSLTLTGEATSPAYTYTAQYSGMLRPDGETSRLSGVQRWTSRHI